MNEGNFNLNQIVDVIESNEQTSSHAYNHSYFLTNKNLPTNIHVLRIHHINESKNYSCQAQNSFGLVVFNLSLIIKGNLILIFFL